MKIPTRQNVIDWVSAAWESTDSELIILGFLRRGISNTVDGLEDDLIQQEIPKQVVTDVDKEEDDDVNPFADIDQVDGFSDSGE